MLQDIASTATHLGAYRIEIVTDQYNQLSIKSQTRLNRKSKDSGEQVNFTADGTVPKDMSKSFLSDEQNKTRLNILIVESCVNPSYWSWKETFCVTNSLENVITNAGKRTMYMPRMNTLEEADNRIVCHIIDMIKCGFSQVTVRTADSGVIVILLAFMPQFLKIDSKH